MPLGHGELQKSVLAAARRERDPMDPYELTKMLYARVQAVDPKNVSKIIGYLLLQDEAEQEMLQMALGSDALLFSVVAKAKQELGLFASADPHAQLLWPPSTGDHVIPSGLEFSLLAGDLQSQYHPKNVYHHHPLLNSHLSQAAAFQKQLQQQPQHGFVSSDILNRSSLMHESYLQQQQPFLCGGVFPNDHFYPETFALLNRSRLKQQHKMEEHDLMMSLSEHGSPNSSKSSNSSNNTCSSNNAWKPCVYYSRGHCKHGSGCRFLHTPYSNEIQQDLMMPELQKLERLEIELQELLRARKSPVLISALPQLYFEEFSRPLHAEGYFNGEDRKAAGGSSLSNLLCHLRNPILIEQQNGQHALVLAEDVPRFAQHRVENYDHNGISPSSRQIYLTFPAESTFTEEDVNAHFSAYGPVQDVRIPYQQKRMFGFVTFLHSETVKVILAEGNPHYICGARVLVKPYRDKVKHSDKKNSDQPRCFQNGIHARNEDLLASKPFEENMQLQRESYLQRRLAEFQLNSAEQYCTEAQSTTSSIEPAIQTCQDDKTLQETNSKARYTLAEENNLKANQANGDTFSGIGNFPENPFAVTHELKQEMKLIPCERVNDNSVKAAVPTA